MSLYTKAKKLSKTGKKPLELAEELGIKVLFLPLTSMAGLAISIAKKKFIFISSSLSELEQQFVIGHELGHFYLHPSTNFVFILQNTFFHDKHEYQANRFSCELLLGEKTEKYKYSISEVCARGRLDKLVEFILFALEDELWTP